MKKFLILALVVGIALLFGARYLYQHPEKLPGVQEVAKKPLKDLTYIERRNAASAEIKGKKVEVQAVKTDLESHLIGRLRGYGKKTHTNLLAVYGVK